uniref:Small ribosomal subunit protein bS18c n=2 Tax=Liagora TaxID=31487 RepID=A0A1G4P063_9FLOR|nr:Ribosomal protein S18 [Liagora harveyana]YP_009315551.1 Ribosomal protein S18 [Liagora brachyclada]SCW22577.1 Ribosomal protein S18 [Liagora harveyana]SCW24209.1 Ribosomal protein S18 [Liagora brachyclada]
MALYNRKLSPLNNAEVLDYKDIDLLRKFITDQGKILPRRSTGLTSKQQKKLTKAIKQARILALLPFLNKD